MNRLERILAVVNFEKTDRVPVIAQVFGHAAILADVPLKDYLQNGEILARCQLKALEHYGYDAVFALMDVGVETEALGSRLKYYTNQYPVVQTYALENEFGLDALNLINPQKDGRMPELLKAVRMLRQELEDDVLVVGCVLGPMTLATQLLGAEKALYLAIDNPERFSRLLAFTTELATGFGVAQLEAGAHLPIVFDPASSPDVIPPQFYREFVLPCLKPLFEAFRAAGAAANWLHTAGPASPILKFYPEAGVDIANIDFCVDPFEAMQAIPHTCMNGNIKPLAFIEANPEAITREASILLNHFSRRGGFILSSGCEIPPESKPENIQAMIMAVSKYR